MASITLTMTTAVENKQDPWHLTVVNTDQTYNATLNTAGKYLNKNINIDYTTVTGSIASAVEVIGDNSSRISITKGADGVVSGVPTTVKPSGYYVAVEAEGKEFNLQATATVTRAGYLDKNANVTSTSVTVSALSAETTYIPLASTDLSMSVDAENMGKYFSFTTVPREADVILVPEYTNSVAGYMDVVTNGRYIDGRSYWSIQKAFPEAARASEITDLQEAHYERKDIAVETGGALKLPAGWYENSYIPLSALIPDIEGDATTGDMLYGTKAYDEEGRVLTGVMKTYSSESGAAYTNSSDKTTYYTTANTGYGQIPASYVPEAQSIIAGNLARPALTIGDDFTPTISVVDADGSNAGKNIASIQGSITRSTTEPTAGYYVATNTDNSTISISSISKIGKSGWVDVTSEGTPQTGDAVINAAGVTYFSINAGQVESLAGTLSTTTKTNVIDTQPILPGIADNDISYKGTKYPITATATVAMKRNTGSVVRTAGYIEGGTDVVPGGDEREEVITATINLKEAIIEASGGIATNPVVGASQGVSREIETSSVSTPYYVTTTFTASPGTITTCYQVTGAGYTPATAIQSTPSGQFNITPDIPSTQTTYIKEGQTSAATTLTGIDTYFNTTTATTGNLTIETSRTVTQNGYVTTTVSGANGTVTTSRYNIKEAGVWVEAGTVTFTGKSNTVTFNTDMVYRTSLPVGAGTFYEIKADAVALTNYTVSKAKPHLEDQVGWVTADRLSDSAVVTGDTGTFNGTNSIYIELYEGDFSVNSTN